MAQMTFRAQWRTGRYYYQGDTVQDAGLTFTALRPGHSTIPPGSDATRWTTVGVVVGTSTSAALDRTGWAATASDSDQYHPANLAIDGDASTRWATGAAQIAGMYFEADMTAPRTFSRIVLDTTDDPTDQPLAYAVTLSDDGTTWSDPVATGAGQAVTAIPTGIVRARYIRVTQTAAGPGSWWSIHEFLVYP